MITIVLYFVPMYSLHTDSAYFKAGEAISYISIARAISSSHPWRTLYSVVLFALNVLFLVLAFAYPKRWIFILASSIAIFFLIWDFFSKPDSNLIIFTVPLVVSYIGAGLKLIGFIIKPVVHKTGEETGA